jgi:hypothetical protein
VRPRRRRVLRGSTSPPAASTTAPSRTRSSSSSWSAGPRTAGSWERPAATLYDAAKARLPELRDSVADRLLRARRLAQRTQVSVDSLANDSPRLKLVAAIEGSTPERAWPVATAFQDIHRGALARAVAGLDDPLVLLLAAASDGAPDELVARALAIPTAQVPPLTALYGRALARRAARDPAPYRARFATGFEDDTQRIDAFFAALDSDPPAAEAALAGAAFELRLFALAAGAIALGDKAPASWRETARLGLFPTERPYFK